MFRHPFLLLALLAFAAPVARSIEFPTTKHTEDYVSAWGVNLARLKQNFSINDLIGAQMIECSAPATILFPGERATCTIQIVNRGKESVTGPASVRVIQYEYYTKPGDDMFDISPRKIRDLGTQEIALDIAAGGFQDLTITPEIPESFGGYLLVLDQPGQDRILLGSLIRTFKPDTFGASNYRLSMDLEYIPALLRLGSSSNRYGFTPLSGDGKDESFEPIYREIVKHILPYKEAGLPLTLEFGHGVPMGPIQPLGQSRGYLKMVDGKPVISRTYPGDFAWLPEYDAVFKKNVKRLLMEYGWPKGPINAIDLWNEAWNGCSIAGWGADDLRYREIFTAMAEARDEAEKEAGVNVMLLGCDSSSNTQDKLFPDGRDTFLKWLDADSLHYQGLDPASTRKQLVDRKMGKGRVQNWDTESWCANSDERVAALLPTFFAAGLDRGVGIQSKNVVTRDYDVSVLKAGAKEPSRVHVAQTWSVGSAVGALQHFVGNRAFERIVLQGLPWVYAFGDKPDNKGGTTPGTGCLVVVGDLHPVFGSGSVLFRNVRSLAEIKARRPLFDQLGSLPPGSPERVALETEWRNRQPLQAAWLVLEDGGGRFRLADYRGNPIPAEGGKLRVPLDDRGFYLSTDGSAGAMAALVAAVEKADILGLQPVDLRVHDPSAPIGAGATVAIDVRNVTNRPIAGNLELTIGKLALTFDRELKLAPFATATVQVQLAGTADPGNLYALHAVFDAGQDGQALHDEVVRCDVIAKRSIKVDGKLDDWKGVLPQTIWGDGSMSRTDAEAAWWPDRPFNTTTKKGLATAFLAADDQAFYFAAKVADDSPHPGTLRFATRDDDAFFYPETVYTVGKQGGDASALTLTPHTWPKGVRRFTYAKDPILPDGNGTDGVQIAFNVLPPDQKAWYDCPKGTMHGFTTYQTTDYEYALNNVAQEYGGGTEIWRMRTPKLPAKHFYPRSPKAPGEGAVIDGKLEIRYENGMRIVECAIPWSEIPEVKAARDAGQPVKFTFRINDNADIGCLELAKGRSVARRAGAFRPDWAEHWANEIAFGWEK